MSRLANAEIERQCAETKARPLWRLPDSWWEPGCAERMADWIERFVPTEDRLWFTYGSQQ